MAESVLSAHANLGFEEAEALVLQWFDEVGLALGHADHDLLIAWFEDDLPVPGQAELAVEVQLYRLSEGWSQLRWRFHHGAGGPSRALGGELLQALQRSLRDDQRWSIDLCQGEGATGR